MQTYFILDNNIFALVLLGTVAYMSFKNVNNSAPMTKYLKNLVITISLQMVLESAIHVCKHLDVTYANTAIFYLQTLAYITSLLSPYNLAMFVIHFVGYTRYIDVKKVLLQVPALLGTFLAILNIFIPVIFRIDVAGNLVEYYMYEYNSATGLLMLAAMLTVAVLNRKKITRKEIYSLGIFAALIVIGIGLRLGTNAIFLIYPFVSLALCLQLFFMKNNLSQYDNLTKLWTSDKTDSYLEKIITEGKYTVTVGYIEYLNRGRSNVIKDVQDVAKVITSTCATTAKKSRYSTVKYMVIYLNTEKSVVEEEMRNVVANAKEKNLDVCYVIDEYNKEEYYSRGQYLRHLEILLEKKHAGGGVLC